MMGDWRYLPRQGVHQPDQTVTAPKLTFNGVKPQGHKIKVEEADIQCCYPKTSPFKVFFWNYETLPQISKLKISFHFFQTNRS